MDDKSGSLKEKKAVVKRDFDKHNSAGGCNSKKDNNVHDPHDIEDNVSRPSQGFEKSHIACNHWILLMSRQRQNVCTFKIKCCVAMVLTRR